MAYTWTELLDDIKVRGSIPTSQSTYTEARLLRLADAVFRSKILPIVDKVREGYYSYDVDFTVANGSSFLIPTRAVGAKLENVAYLNGNQRQDATRYYEEELLDLTLAPSWKPGFYLKRNRIFPVPSDGGGYTTLRLSIIMRPNKFCVNSDACQVTAINTGTKTLTFDTVPDWDTGDTLDIIQDSPHFDWLAIDQVVTAVTTTTIAFSSALPADLAVGDWVSLAGETPVIQCPVELHPLLAQEVANVCLKAQTDQAAYTLGKDEAELIKEGIIALLSPRVEQEGRKISNRTGLLRRRG